MVLAKNFGYKAHICLANDDENASFLHQRRLELKYERWVCQRDRESLELAVHITLPFEEKNENGWNEKQSWQIRFWYFVIQTPVL